MNNRFHSEAKLPWSYDYPLANHIVTNKNSAKLWDAPVFAPLAFFQVSLENFPAKGFKILPIAFWVSVAQTPFHVWHVKAKLVVPSELVFSIYYKCLSGWRMHHLDTLSLHHFYDELPRFADIPHHPQMNMHILVYTMKTPFAYKSIAQVPCYRTWFSFSCCIRSFSSISRSSSCCLSSAAFSGPHSRVYSTIAMV